MSAYTALALEPMLQSRLALFSDDSLSRDERMWAYYQPGKPYVSPPVDVQNLRAGGADNAVPVRVYQSVDPGARAGIALVWFHGGGFVGGDLEVVEANVTARELVVRAGITVISVDYRLCNDAVTFPAPQEDAVVATLWARDRLSELGCASLFVGGGSAGACLSGSLVQLLRDRGAQQVDGALLFYPVAHVQLPRFDESQRARHDLLPPELAFDPEWALSHNERLMGRAASTSTGHDFPGDAKDLRGLPPTLIVNAEFDSLAASGELFALQLARAGVEVTTFTEPAVTHGHLAYSPQELAAADHSINSMIEFMSRHARGSVHGGEANV